MSRFCFCNCPAGFSAEPDRHAPDCPGRSGAGKARTPVQAVLADSQQVDSGVDFGIDGRSVRVSQEAYSIFLAREAAGREKIAVLQQRLDAAVSAHGKPLAQKYDDTLIPFVALMRKELHANAGKGDRPGWLSMSADACMLEIIYHFGKLQASVKRGDGDGMAEYGADVANLCMMLLDICGVINLVQHTEQPAPVTVVPDGYCIMPRQLTAENGAKALLLGEFKLLVTKECPECCELEDPVEGCSICDGEGEYGQKHTIPWDQIKFIYSKAVSGLAVKAESAKTR